MQFSMKTAHEDTYSPLTKCLLYNLAITNVAAMRNFEGFFLYKFNIDKMLLLLIPLVLLLLVCNTSKFECYEIFNNSAFLLSVF
jgi:hypothetical protein